VGAALEDRDSWIGIIADGARPARGRVSAPGATNNPGLAPTLR